MKITDKIIFKAKCACGREYILYKSLECTQIKDLLNISLCGFCHPSRTKKKIELDNSERNRKFLNKYTYNLNDDDGTTQA